MNTFLRDLALAHQTHEGWFPGSVSQRNSNPGNLRYRSYHRAYGGEPGYLNFAKFPTYALGFQALMDDLRAKITGHSAHIDYRRNPTFLTYIRVYAPRDDGNNPEGYTQQLIRLLPQYNLSPSTPLSELARLISGVPVPPNNPKIARRRAERLAANSKEPMASRILRRISFLFPQ